MNTLTQNIRNRSTRYVSPKEVHQSWKTKSKKALTYKSKQHKKVVSKAVLRRQSKNFYTIEHEDSSMCGWVDTTCDGEPTDHTVVVKTIWNVDRYCYEW